MVVLFILCSFESATEFRKLCNIEFNGKIKENEEENGDDDDGKKEVCFEPDNKNVGTYMYVCEHI